MSDIVKVKEESKSKFRLFGSLEYKTIEVPQELTGDTSVSFKARPMNHSERARFNVAESNYHSSLDWVKAVKDSGVDLEAMPKVGKDVGDYTGKELALLSQVTSQLEADPSKIGEFVSEIGVMLTACVESFTVDGGETTKFTAELFNVMESDEVRVWLVGQIRELSNPDSDELKGL